MTKIPPAQPHFSHSGVTVSVTGPPTSGLPLFLLASPPSPMMFIRTLRQMSPNLLDLQLTPAVELNGIPTSSW